jgi:hypothetical protein
MKTIAELAEDQEDFSNYPSKFDVNSRQADDSINQPEVRLTD